MDPYWDRPQAHSAAKARIARRFFGLWVPIIGHTLLRQDAQPRVLYRDYYAGRGAFRDGTPSTPSLVLDECAQSPMAASMVELRLNELRDDTCAELRDLVSQHPALSKLRHAPRITQGDAHDRISEFGLEPDRALPSFFFLDPYGWVDIRLTEIRELLRPWGSDGLIYFDVDRLIMDLSKPEGIAPKSLENLFGSDYLPDLLHAMRQGGKKEDREKLVVRTFEKALTGIGAAFTFPFRIMQEGRDVPSYYLVFVTKNFKGYEKMKEVMREESSEYCFALETYEFKSRDVGQGGLFDSEFVRIAKDQLRSFPWDTNGTRFEDAYKALSPGTPCIRKDFTIGLLEMDRNGELRALTEKGKPISERGVGNEARIWLGKYKED